MSKCSRCHKNLPCGCADSALTTIPTDYSSTCPTPQLCSEFTYTGCILYSGPEIVNIGVTPGMNLNEVIQRLIIYATDPINNPKCLSLAYGPCQSVTDLEVSLITRTTAHITWNNNHPDNPLTLTWSPATPSPGFTTLASGVTTYDLTGMTPNTEYTIFISTPCNQQSPCISVTIRFSTLL